MISRVRIRALRLQIGQSLYCREHALGSLCIRQISKAAWRSGGDFRDRSAVYSGVASWEVDKDSMNRRQAASPIVKFLGPLNTPLLVVPDEHVSGL